MFCPQCGTKQSDEFKFCKLCGVNLQAVGQVINTREAVEPFDWSKTWVTEMFLSAGEQARRKEELDRQRGITPEIKRYKEIKAGVITGSVGIGVAVFLFILMQGIILSGEVSQGGAEILRRVWAVGIIPLFIGLAIIINGLLVSRKIVEVTKREAPTEPKVLNQSAAPPSLRAADTAEFIPPDFSVTEEATKHLRNAR